MKSPFDDSSLSFYTFGDRRLFEDRPWEAARKVLCFSGQSTKRGGWVKGLSIMEKDFFFLVFDSSFDHHAEVVKRTIKY